MQNDPLSEASAAQLIKTALEQSRELLKAEMALARQEALSQIDALKQAVSAGGLCVVTAILGIAMLLVAIVVAVAPQPQTALGIGIFLLVVAAIAGGLGYKKLPAKPLAQTQKELKADVKMLKERIA